MSMLEDLMLCKNAKTRSICAENPDGAKGGGARAEVEGKEHAARELGKGWKVRPSLSIPPHSVTVLAEIEDMAVMRRSFCAMQSRRGSWDAKFLKWMRDGTEGSRTGAAVWGTGERSWTGPFTEGWRSLQTKFGEWGWDSACGWNRSGSWKEPPCIEPIRNGLPGGAAGDIIRSSGRGSPMNISARRCWKSLRSMGWPG